MSINVHYCGKIVEYSTPKQRIHEDYIYTKKERSYVYTGKQEIKIIIHPDCYPLLSNEEGYWY